MKKYTPMRGASRKSGKNAKKRGLHSGAFSFLLNSYFRKKRGV